MDIDAPSVVTVLLYQLKYADAVSSGVTYKSWVSTSARCYETASCLIEKHGQFFFHATRGNGGCFAATNPNQWSPTDYVYNYIYEWAPPFHQSWIRYWNISMSWQWELPEVLPPPLPICWICFRAVPVQNSCYLWLCTTNNIMYIHISLKRIHAHTETEMYAWMDAHIM